MKLYTKFNVDDVYNHIKSLEPLEIAYHGDADGVGSAALLSNIFQVKSTYNPGVFGGYKEGNVAVDSGAPLLKEFYENRSCIVIDHHEHGDNPSYPLVLGNIPTGGIIYELFKDKLPVEKRFLAVLSLVGDGQPELIPDEIWETVPELWHMQGNIYKSKFNSIKGYPYPLFAKISSPINALCKIGAVSKALEIATRANNIREIIFNPTAQAAQKELNSEEYRIFADSSNPISIETIGKFSIVIYRSKYDIGSRILANLMKTDKNTTYTIINDTTRSVSVRGIMSKFLTNKLNERGYLAGGHAGFCGVTMLQSNTIEGLLGDLRDILTNI